MATKHYAVQSEDEESYFISMTDVVIGLLFIFIIMLMFFAMRFQEATHTQNEATQKQNKLIDDLTGSETTRSNILQNIGSFLQKKGINVTIITDEGILRLPEEILFGRSSWELNAKGVEALKSLGEALDQVLPCYTIGTKSRQDNCPKTKAKIEAIFIEGHADSDPFRNPTVIAGPTPEQRRPVNNPQISTTQRPLGQNDQRGAGREAPPPKDNLDLSTLRATSTFRELLRARQGLDQFLNENGKRVLSVSGYGEYRPLATEAGESPDQYKQRNRRIDLRILMSTPRSEDAKKMRQELEPIERHP